ncbi:MAG: hypothetical protein AB1609_14690, partial [Bacillota bacterium]
RQQKACGQLPTDRRVVVESFPDELGDRRVAVHSLWGRRVNRAWALAMTAYARRLGLEIDAVAADDGVALRLPAEASVSLEQLAMCAGDDPVRLVLEQLPGSPVVAQLFRQAASRALFITRTRRGRRLPLWQQRLRAADLMLMQSRSDGPGAVLFREALREAADEAFDLEALGALARGFESGEIEVVVVERPAPSPFAASLLFEFTAAFLYEPDAPKAERQAAVLVGSPDQTLREAAAAGTLSHLIDPAVFSEMARRWESPPWAGSRRAPSGPEDIDEWLRLSGDLSERELAAALAGGAAPWRAWIEELERAGRVFRRGATFVHFTLAPLLAGLDAADPEEQAEALASLISQRSLARPGPLLPEEAAARYGVTRALAERALSILSARGAMLYGTLDPAGPPAYLAVPALLAARRRTLELSRQRSAPVAADTFARFLAFHHYLMATAPSNAADPAAAAVDAIRRLAGLRARLSDWTRLLLGARLKARAARGLAQAIAAGQVGWAVLPAPSDSRAGAGVTFFARAAGRTACALVGSFNPSPREREVSPEQQAVMRLLAGGGSWFGWEIAERAGFDQVTTSRVLLDLVRAGLVSAESIRPLEAALQDAPAKEGAGSAPHPAGTGPGSLLGLPGAAPEGSAGRPPVRPMGPAAYRRLSRRLRREAWARAQAIARAHAAGETGDREGAGSGAPDPAELAGVRFYTVVLPETPDGAASRSQAWVRVLLDRYGVVSREMAAADGCPLPWAYLAQALEQMEARGEVVRGYLVEGLSGEQFARPEDVEELRRHAGPAAKQAWAVSASDPALPYGRLLPAPPWWPSNISGGWVALADGRPVIFFRPGAGALWYDPDAPEEDRAAALEALLRLAASAYPGRRLVIRSVQGQVVGVVRQKLRWLIRAGFTEGPRSVERWLD